MTLLTAFLIAIQTLLPSAQAQQKSQFSTHDADLSAPPTLTVENLGQETFSIAGKRVFQAQTLYAIKPLDEPKTPAVYGELLLTDPKGRHQAGRLVHVLLVSEDGVMLSDTKTDEHGRFNLPIPNDARGQRADVRLRLENAFWSIRNPETADPYEWEAAQVLIPASGSVSAGFFELAPTAENGKIGYIHLQYLKAIDFFSAQGIAMNWWSENLGVFYPAGGDYFSPFDFTLHITHPETWDVNLHEFGHAVMDAGISAPGAGGEHKIDGCYSGALAWSEGWASFFAAVVGISRDDADAKFEFMVPRRAPIDIETVPADVCRGDANEWRVTAGLWDLYDTHVDGPDVIALSFAKIWNALRGRNIKTFKDAWKYLAPALSMQERQDALAALQYNTLLPKSDPIQTPVAQKASLPYPSPSLLTAPDWNGLKTP